MVLAVLAPAHLRHVGFITGTYLCCWPGPLCELHRRQPGLRQLQRPQPPTDVVLSLPTTPSPAQPTCVTVCN